ncbi:MAG: hypothetical protein AAF585_28775 [Verrucomicrobiota bacterium]
MKFWISAAAIFIFSLPLHLRGEVVEIKPGMQFPILVDRLATKGIEVNRKYALSMMSGRLDTTLDFAILDDNTTLVVAYKKQSKEVTSLGVVFIPDNRTSKAQIVERGAKSIKIHDDDEIEIRFQPIRKRKRK